MEQSTSNRLEYHHCRRIFHLLPGLVIIAVSYIIPPFPQGAALLAAITARLYYMDVRRANDRDYDIWYLRQYGQLLRAEERGEWILVDNASDKYKRKFYPILPGAFYWLLGTTLISVMFAPDVARTALLVLSVSDPFAAYMGVLFSNNHCNITWSRLRNIVTRGEKGRRSGSTVVGSMACAFATLLCTYVYFPNRSAPTLAMSSRLVVSAFTAIVEAMTGRWMVLPIDDNLLIPLIVGGLVTYLME